MKPIHKMIAVLRVTSLSPEPLHDFGKLNAQRKKRKLVTGYLIKQPSPLTWFNSSVVFRRTNFPQTTGKVINLYQFLLRKKSQESSKKHNIPDGQPRWDFVGAWDCPGKAGGCSGIYYHATKCAHKVFQLSSLLVVDSNCLSPQCHIVHDIVHPESWIYTAYRLLKAIRESLFW